MSISYSHLIRLHTKFSKKTKQQNTNLLLCEEILQSSGAQAHCRLIEDQECVKVTNSQHAKPTMPNYTLKQQAMKSTFTSYQCE